MQTREPNKRVNWVFVIVLIVAVPLIVFTIFMMNTIPPKPQVTSQYDSLEVGVDTTDSIKPDTSTKAGKDSSLIDK